MAKKYIITAENAAEIKEFRKSVKDKYLDRKLYAVQLLGEGVKPKEIAEKLGADKRQISRLASQFCNGEGMYFAIYSGNESNRTDLGRNKRKSILQ